MKQNIISTIQFIFCLLVMQQSFCQTEKFDIITYTPPKDPTGTGWKKESKQSFVSHITVNQNTGGFCLIALYAAVPGTGTPEKDFAKEWNDLVVTPYHAEKNPKTETQTNADGWKVVSGAAAVQRDNINSYIILSVFSGFGKTVSVLANLNDQSYIAEVDKFLENISPDKTATPANTTAVAKNNDQPDKFGQLLYTTPAGWKATKYQNGVVLTPVDLPAKEHLDIQVMQAINFSGTMEQAFEKIYNETCTTLRVTKMWEVSGLNYTAKEPKKSFRGWEYIRGSGGIQVNNGTPYPDEYGLELFVIKINNRFERIAIIQSRNTYGGYNRYYPSDRLNYRNAVEGFLFSLKFDDWKEPVVKTGAAKGEDITGVWQGISMSVGIPNRGAELGAGLKVQQLILFSNGQAFFGTNFPVEGLDELNTWIAAENNRRSWGTYSFSNDKGVLKMPYADIPLQMENNKLTITTNKTDHSFIKLSPVDGARFNGTYTLSEWNGMIPAISFTSDGKFIDKGAVRILYHESTDCLNEALTPGSGTYEVKNNSMIFNYSDGRKIKIAVTGSGFDKNNSSPAILTLSFNEDVMKRQ